ncbi:hypothetical protein D3C72_1730170 [compost metagenome]
MEDGGKRCNLLLQLCRQLAAGAQRNARDVVDGLVGIQLDALPAHDRQGIADMRLHALQPELESSEEPHRSGADDERIHLLRSRGINTGNG